MNLTVIKIYWQRANVWYEGRNKREKILLFMVSIFVIYSTWNLLLAWPVQMRTKDVTNQIARLTASLDTDKAQHTVLTAKISSDPSIALHKQEAELTEELRKVDQDLSEAVSETTSQAALVKAFETLLHETPNLQLMRLESLPPEALSSTSKIMQQTGMESSNTAIFKKGLLIEFLGSYSSTLQYLVSLEKLNVRFYWDSMDYIVTSYPNATVTIKIHVLGQGEGLIGG